MTFNATSINNLNSATGPLIRWEALRPLTAPVRFLDTTLEIKNLLDGQFPDTGFAHWAADRDIARYLAGYLVNVSLRGTSGSSVDWERLEGADEVWMLCLRQPRPGWRLFGRFRAQNKFVALRAYDRVWLDGRTKFEGPIRATIDDWDAIVGAQPLRGATVDEYLTGVWRDIDEPE